MVPMVILPGCGYIFWIAAGTHLNRISAKLYEPTESKSNSVSMNHLENVLPEHIFDLIPNAPISSKGGGSQCLETLTILS